MQIRYLDNEADAGVDGMCSGQRALPLQRSVWWLWPAAPVLVLIVPAAILAYLTPEATYIRAWRSPKTSVLDDNSALSRSRSARSAASSASAKAPSVKIDSASALGSLASPLTVSSCSARTASARARPRPEPAISPGPERGRLSRATVEAAVSVPLTPEPEKQRKRTDYSPRPRSTELTVRRMILQSFHSVHDST